MEEKTVVSVSQLNRYIKSVIDSNALLQGVYVSGEISNFTNHRSGHWYFTLKDGTALIRAVMFASSAQKVPFIPKNGMKVIVHARVSVFERDGQYQLYATSMTTDGMGDLHLAFEQLKQKLLDQGLFDESNKKPLPKIPLRIGIITSPTGAAVRDMIHILNRRFPMAVPVLYPALVQGEKAPQDLIGGLRYFNRYPADVIILGRGGGSIEELWAFNNEQLAHEIYHSTVPVISAVGHETDFTISDFVADRRAPTPSAAAEIAVPDTAELSGKFANVTARLRTILVSRMDAGRSKLSSLQNTRVLRNPLEYVETKRELVDFLYGKIQNEAKHMISTKRGDFLKTAAQLEALNPLSVMNRGFSVTEKQVDGRTVYVSDIAQLSCGDRVVLRYHNGSAQAQILEVNADRQRKKSVKRSQKD